jgi:putative ABC transport system permease protein
MRPSPARFDPSVLGMRWSALVALYQQRLRHDRFAELLAGTGIAVGVALVFGVLVANGSILGSTREVIQAVDGSASLELVARSPHGFDQQLAKRASELPGVMSSASVLRESAVIEGPKGHVLGQLVGVTPSVVTFGGSATKDLGAGALLLSGGIGLPSGVAHSIGVEVEQHAQLAINGSIRRTRVRAVLDSGAIGSLSSSRIVVALLNNAQSLAGEPGRVTELLVKPEPGDQAKVWQELRRVRGMQADVEPADHELRLAERAMKPTSQSTTLFAAISVMVGFLLALNAMLLTVPERRRQLAEMREQGYDTRQIAAVLCSQSFVLGAMASIAGIAVGMVLARTLFDVVPSYLATTFPITGHQEVRWTTVLLAFGAGVLACALASICPLLLDMRSRRPVDAVLHDAGESGQNISGQTARRMAILAVMIVGLTTTSVFLESGLTIPAGVMLALAALCAMPLLFSGTTHVLERIASKYHGGMVAVASIELKATATRSVAVGAITALAIYGSVAVGGARTDLIRGLDEGISQQWGSASVWVTPNENIHDTDSFHAKGVAGDIARAPGVASVSAHQGAFLDVGSLRLWVRAVPAGDPSMVLPSQLLQGEIGRADLLMRHPGWATISSGLASERHLHLGSVFSLPTPSGQASFRVAAITTNIGWPPGTITLNTADYGRYWQSTDPTTLAVDLKPGVSARAGRDAVERAIVGTVGLRVQTSGERIGEVEGIARQGLSILIDISLMLLLISALALASALSTAIYQRRGRLIELKEQGFDRMQVWRGLLLESAVVLTIGCLDGTILGVFGHALADRYLRLSTGFPAPFGMGTLQIVLTLLIVVAVSLAVIALPGYSAASISTEVSFQE